jgi:multidrug resistance efflux pump
MAKNIELTKAERDVFADQDSSWMALDLPEIKPPIYSKAFILFLSAFLVTGVIYSAVTEVPVVIESGGKLATSKPAIPIRALSTFTVDSVRVIENQIVKGGEVLVASSDGLSPEELTLVRELQANLGYINSQPANQCNNCFPSIQKVLGAAVKLSKNHVAKQVIKPVADACQDLGQNMLKLKNVDQKTQPLRTRLASLSKPGGRQPASVSTAAAKEIKQLQGMLQQNYQSIMEALSKSRSNVQNAARATASSFDELANLSGLKAPIDGKIVNIRLKGAGEMVGGGQPVMEIIPIDSRIIANIEVMNKDIGSVHVGDAVEVSVDAYPEMDYGTLKGKISEILPAESNEMGGPPGMDRGFKVRVALDSQELQAGGATYKLLPGMTVRARTMKKQETLLKTFYRSIFRIKEDIRVRS